MQTILCITTVHFAHPTSQSFSSYERIPEFSSVIAQCLFVLPPDVIAPFITRNAREMRRLKNQNMAIEAAILHEIRPTDE